MTSLHATTAGFSQPVNSYISSYLEYGLTDRLTLGFDIGHSVSGQSKAVLFARYPLATNTGQNKYAVELGAGVIASQFVVRPGFSFGRGLSFARGSGWISADVTLEHYLRLNQTDVKADITLGRNLDGGFKSMLQIQAGKRYGDRAFLRLVPTVAVPVGQKNHIELGASVGVTGPLEYGLKIGLWRSF